MRKTVGVLSQLIDSLKRKRGGLGKKTGRRLRLGSHEF